MSMRFIVYPSRKYKQPLAIGLDKMEDCKRYLSSDAHKHIS